MRHLERPIVVIEDDNSFRRLFVENLVDQGVDPVMIAQFQWGKDFIELGYPRISCEFSKIVTDYACAYPGDSPIPHLQRVRELNNEMPFAIVTTRMRSSRDLLPARTSWHSKLGAVQSIVKEILNVE